MFKIDPYPILSLRNNHGKLNLSTHSSLDSIIVFPLDLLIHKLTQALDFVTLPRFFHNGHPLPSVSYRFRN